MQEKQAKSKIEEIAAELLDSDKAESFLDFFDFLSKNKLTKSKTAENSWTVRYKSKIICHFRIRKGYWFVSYFKLFAHTGLFDKCEKYASDELKEIILNNINTKPGCPRCNGVENQIIFGKKFDRMCHCHPLMLSNPVGKMLEYAKEIVFINKKIVDDILEYS